MRERGGSWPECLVRPYSQLGRVLTLADWPWVVSGAQA